MGISSDAMLIWGMDFGEDPPFPFDVEGFETDVVWDYMKDHPLLEHVPHCSYESTMHVIGLRSTYKCASRGCPVEMIEIPPVGDPTPIREFCEHFGLEYKEPSWILCSMMG